MEEQAEHLKQEYKDWLNRKYAASTVSSYVGMLSRCPADLKGIELPTINVFEISDPDQYKLVKETMHAAENFDEVNKKADNKAFYYGLKYYEDFLRERREGSKVGLSRTDFPAGPLLEKNIILYGPPGTGKTYHTVLYAVAIIEKRSLEDMRAEAEADGNKGYAKIKKRYDEYKTAEQIVFTTFHQSFGYEEFMEGIKPVIAADEAADVSGDISYKIEPGIFKKFCKKAYEPIVAAHNDYGIREEPVVWKVSLGDSKDKGIVKRYCFDHGMIRLGWDEYGENMDENTVYVKGGKDVINRFINDMQQGDIAMVLSDEKHIEAIGVVTGDYEWREDLDSYKRTRKVKWLLKGIRENIMEMNGGTKLTLSSVYRLHRIGMKDVRSILTKHPGPNPDSVVRENPNNYVFIIDEVNRGNISKIFGELITLIEPSKRLGMPEEITLQLPYSGDFFGVPNNVYLLATMNTADRSIARLDTALRRRFNFAEMMPDPKLLSSLNIADTELDIEKMLTMINRRIEALYDREHMLGHAYFLSLKNEPTLKKLGHLFEHTVIPLLQEYFYEDYEKIRLVLGDNGKPQKEQFIEEIRIDAKGLFGGGGEQYVDEYKTYRINAEAFNRIEAYRGIYETKVSAPGAVQP